MVGSRGPCWRLVGSLSLFWQWVFTFTFQRLAGGWAVCLWAVLNCDRESLPFSAWMVVGCVFAGIAGVCTVVALVCYCLKKKGKPGRVVHPSHYCHHHPHTDPSVVYTGKNRSHRPLDLKLQVLVTGQITFLCPRLFSKYSKTVWRHTYHCQRICFSWNRRAEFRFNEYIYFSCGLVLISFCKYARYKRSSFFPWSSLTSPYALSIISKIPF